MNRRPGNTQPTDSRGDLRARTSLLKHIQQIRQSIDERGAPRHRADPSIEAALADLEREAERVAARYQRYEAVAEAGHDIVYAVDAEGVFTYVSPQVRRYDLEPSEMVGQQHLDFVDPRDRESAVQAFQNAVEGGEEHPFEFRLLSPDGAVHWMEEHGHVQRDDAGRLAGLIGVVREITGRKQAETALRESEARFHSLFDNVPVGIYRTTPDGRILDANIAFVEMFGYPSREALLTVPAEATYANPRDRQRWQEIMQREGTVRNFEVQGRRRDGAVIWVRDSSRVVRDERGNALYYEGSVEDITERKTAEDALRDHEARLRLMVEQMPAILWTTDPDLRVTSAAGAGFAALGRPPDEFVGANLKDVLGGDGDDHAAVPAHYRALAGESVAFEEQYGGMSYESHVEPLHDAAGHIVGVIGVGLDVTEQRRLEQEILRISDAERRRIGQDLHDSVGQQLTGLLFTIAALHRRLVAKGLPEAAEAREAQDVVTSLGAEVRALARGLCPVEVEEGGLMGALDALAREAHERVGIPCTFDCQPPVPVQDDVAATHLYRIAQEAVTNAVRHGQPQSIHIALTARDGKLTLTVQDDGRGPPPDWQESEGLGLHGMTYRARRLGGTVQLRPAPKQGARLTCTVPYRKPLQPGDPVKGSRDGERTPRPPRAE